jgi:hypothetical protein
MSNQPRKRTVKIVNVSVSYHPDFNINPDGTPQILPTGYWGVEWTVKEFGVKICEHYLAKFDNKKEAEMFQDKLGGICWFFCPYKEVPVDNEIFTHGELIACVEPNKRLNVFLPKNH